MYNSICNNSNVNLFSSRHNTANFPSAILPTVGSDSIKWYEQMGVNPL